MRVGRVLEAVVFIITRTYVWLHNNSALNMTVYNFSHVKVSAGVAALLCEIFRGLGSLSLSSVVSSPCWSNMAPNTSTSRPLG